jgi:acetylglutamate kinase
VKKILIKVGGTLIDSAETLASLAQQLAPFAKSERLVIVHGGGKQMTHYLNDRGVESSFVDGLRVTTPAVVDALLKVFAGTVNHQLVAALVGANISAVGISGIDAALVECEQLSANLGAVGRPVRCNESLFTALHSGSFVPTVACVGGDRQGNIYNVNADQMAVACAKGFQADLLIFMTDVAGVRDASGQTARQLTIAQMKQLIAEGVATGGMQAKLNSAIEALENGVKTVMIVPGMAPNIVADSVMQKAVGTRLVA